MAHGAELTLPQRDPLDADPFLAVFSFDRTRVLAQRALEPRDRLGVEMICWLIEEEEVRF